MAGTKRSDERPESSESSELEGSVQREGAAGDLDRREDEGWDQPQSSAKKIPHRQDDQDDVQ